MMYEVINTPTLQDGHFAFELRNQVTEEIRMCTEEEVYKSIFDGEVCGLVMCNGNPSLSNFAIMAWKEVPYKIVARFEELSPIGFGVSNGFGKTGGYILEDEFGREYALRCSEVCSLAKIGIVKNAEINPYANYLIGIKLNTLKRVIPDYEKIYPRKYIEKIYQRNEKNLQYCKLTS